MASLITPQFERYIAEQTIAQGHVVFDEFIFANIPGLNENNLAQHLTMPTSAQIVHRQAVSQNGVINENAVVYSVTIGTEVGDFDFNFIGLINKSKNLLAVAVQTAPVRKTRNKNAVQGNSITRNILLEFSGAKSLTGINVSAETWQIDFTVRLHGIDEKIRLTNRDLYGRAVFFDDGFLVQRKTGNQFTIKPGLAYVEGVRMNLAALHTLTANNLPCSIYTDVVHHCTVTGAYETEIKYLTQSKDDYVDTANRQHYVQILADIDRNGNVTDRRLLSPFLGITPKDLDDTTVNKADKTGHTHKLPIASLVKRGIAKLYSGYDSDSEEMAATPKAIKGLKALIDAVTRNLGNYIPNSKKSNAVNSPSSDTIATSAAAKTAYDKGVEAKTAADNAQRTANDGVNKANAAQTAANNANKNATNANNNANTRASKRGLSSSDDLNNITASGIYGQNANVNATPQRHYPIQQAGMLLVTEYSGYGAQQLYAPFYAGYLYARGRNANNGWDDWKRIDGLDRVLKSGDTMTGNLTINHGEPRVHGNRNNSNNWYVGLPNGTSNNLHLHSYANNTSLVLESDKISTTKPVFSAGNRTAVSLSGHNIQFRWNNSGNLDLKIDNTELGQLHYTNQRYAVVTANNGDYAGLHIQRKGTSGNFWARAEALPDRRWKFVTEGGASVFMQNKSGTLALLEDIRKERLIWSGSSTQSITVNVGVTSGILLILLRTRGRQMWHCISIEHCNNTVIGFTEYGGENADKDYSNTALVTRNGSNITIGASRWAEVNKVILLGA